MKADFGKMLQNQEYKKKGLIISFRIYKRLFKLFK